MALTYIYGLFDVRDKSNIRYIGKSNNPQKRISRHIIEGLKLCKNDHKSSWIRSVYAKQSVINFVIIECCSIESWKDREVYWISYYKNNGYDLTNYKKGGDGGVSFKYLMTYEECKNWFKVNTPQVKSLNNLRTYINTTGLPPYIPRNPYRTYKNNGWISSFDFFETHNFKHPQKNRYEGLYIDNYDYAKCILKPFNIKSREEYVLKCNYGEIKNLPVGARGYYHRKGTWVSWDDFLGKNKNIKTLNK